MTTEIRTLEFSALGFPSVTSDPILCTTDGLGAIRAIGDLVWLLDAQEGMVGNGTNLVSFEDVSGNGRECVIGNAPLMTSTTWTGGGGKPALKFNRSSTHYIKVRSPSTPQPFTIFSIIDQYTVGDPAASNSNLVNPGSGICYRIASSDKWSQYAGTPQQSNIASSTSTGKYIRFDIFNGAASRVYRSGTASAATNPGAASTANAFVGIGARNDGVDACSVIYAGGGMFAKALTVAQMSDILSFYTARYPGINAT